MDGGNQGKWSFRESEIQRVSTEKTKNAYQTSNAKSTRKNMSFPITAMKNQINQQSKYSRKKILVNLKNMNIKFTSNNLLQNFIKSGYKNNSGTNTNQEPRILHFPAFVEKGKYGNDRKNNTQSLERSYMLIKEKYTYENGNDETCGRSYGKQNIGVNVAQRIHLEKNNASECDSPKQRCPHHRWCA